MYNEIFNPVKQNPGGRWFYNEEKNISVAHIPKNGTTTLKATLKPGWVLGKYVPSESAAIIRHPLSRWISGFATHLSLRIDHGRANYSDIKSILTSVDGWNYVMDIIAFDIHTKPQYLFLDGVPELILFDNKEQRFFYEWLKSHGLEIEVLDVHNSKDFPKDSHNYKLKKILEEIVYKDLNIMKRIVKFYKKDLELYETCPNN